MTQFLGFALFLVIIAGLALHAGVERPWWLEWFGQLPGDMIIKKKGLTIYMPLTSSLIVSAAISFVFSLFSRK